MTTEYKFMQEEKPRPQNKQVAKWRICGETLTLGEIAKRINVTEVVASSRLRTLRHASGAIDWQRLQAFKPSPNRRKAV